MPTGPVTWAVNSAGTTMIPFLYFGEKEVFVCSLVSV